MTNFPSTVEEDSDQQCDRMSSDGDYELKTELFSEWLLSGFLYFLIIVIGTFPYGDRVRI